MRKFSDIDPKEELWRGTIVKIHRWFKCPTGFYDYDLMLIDGATITGSHFDVICINYSAGARNIMSPLETNIAGKQAITAERLFEKTLSMLNAIRGRKEEFTKEEVMPHLFVYNIRDIKQINPDLIPFTGDETYNN